MEKIIKLTKRKYLIEIVCLVHCIYGIRKAVHKEAINRDLKKKLNRQMRQYEKLLQDQRTFDVYKHDNRNRYLTLYILLEKGKNEEAKSYTKKLIEGENGRKEARKENSTVLDTIIYEKRRRAEKYYEKFYIKRDIPSNIAVNSDDWTIIIGNLFDNAIEACWYVAPEKRWIKANMKYEKNVLSIEVANSAVMENSNFFGSLGDSDAQHGFGLVSVMKTLKKYQGNIHIGVEEGVCRVIVELTVE